jgi:hypothetical protein
MLPNRGFGVGRVGADWHKSLLNLCFHMAPRAGLPGLNKLNGLWWQPGLKARSDAKGRLPALSNAARRAHGSQRSPEMLGLPMPASALGDSLTGISPGRCHPSENSHTALAASLRLGAVESARTFGAAPWPGSRLFAGRAMGR